MGNSSDIETSTAHLKDSKEGLLDRLERSIWKQQKLRLNRQDQETRTSHRCLLSIKLISLQNQTKQKKWHPERSRLPNPICNPEQKCFLLAHLKSCEIQAAHNPTSSKWSRYSPPKRDHFHFLSVCHSKARALFKHKWNHKTTQLWLVWVQSILWPVKKSQPIP